MADVFDRVIGRVAPAAGSVPPGRSAPAAGSAPAGRSAPGVGSVPAGRPRLVVRPEARFETGPVGTDRSGSDPAAAGKIAEGHVDHVARRNAAPGPPRPGITAARRGTGIGPEPGAGIGDALAGRISIAPTRRARADRVPANGVQGERTGAPGTRLTPFVSGGLDSAPRRGTLPQTPGERSRAPGPEPGGERAASGTGERDAPPAAAAARVIPAAELLADHIAPALVAARALTRREAARLVPVPPGEGRRRRPDGRTPVGLGPVEVPAAGDVHVHIDRLEVIREAPPASPGPAPAVPPRPAAAAPSGAGHAEYLARQRRRWSP